MSSFVQRLRGLGSVITPENFLPLFGRRLVAIGAAIYAVLTLSAIANFFSDIVIFDRSYGYWVATTFTLLQVGLGKFVFERKFIGECPPSIPAAMLFYAGVGTFASYAILMALGLADWLDARGVVVYFAIIAAPAFLGLRSLGRGASYVSAVPDINASDRRESVQAFWIATAIGVIWIAPYFIQTLFVNLDWDGAAYHLPLAEAFIEKGIWWNDPLFNQRNFPGAMSLFYALFLSLDAESAILPFNFLGSVGVIVGVYAFARHFWGTAAGLWAGAIAASMNLLWELGLDPRIDAFLALACLLAVFAIWLWSERPSASGWLVVAGMMLGLAMGLKYTAGAFVLLLAVATLIRLARVRAQDRSQLLRPICLLLLCLTLPSVLWYARNAINTGDPLYPYAHGMVYEDADGKRRALEPDVRAMMGDFLESAKYKASREEWEWRTEGNTSPRSLYRFWDVLLHPRDYARKDFHAVSPFLLFFLLFPLVVRDRTAFALFVVAITAYLIIGRTTYIVRVALPVLPLMCVGAGAAIARIRLRPLSILLAALLFGWLGWNFAIESKKTVRRYPLRMLSDEWSQVEQVTVHGYNNARDAGALARWVNRQIEEGKFSADAKIFMVGEGKGRLLNCDYVPDSGRVGHRWLADLARAGGDHEAIRASMKERGIEYIAYGKGYFHWAKGNLTAEAEGLAFNLAVDFEMLLYSENELAEFLRHNGRKIYDDQGIQLYRLNGND